jgi:hypothetical protein
MSSRFDIIAQYLLQKPFYDCTINELQQLVLEQPFLAPAQFLLAKKKLVEGLPGAGAQMQKAALYYHQPAAFDAFLNADFPDPELFYKEEATETESDDGPPLPIHINLPGKDSYAEQPEINSPENSANGNDTIEQGQVEDTPIVEPVIKESPVVDAVMLEPEKIVATQTKAIQEAAIIDTPIAPEPAPSEAALPAFEPYHTIDYFASQGIKLSQEEASKDKMGRQLKSFTEWLKTMKRLPATEQLKDLDPNAEQKVEHLAAHSVAEADIVTEAMAEVWIKQGNLDKAAAVYHKLSLSNPSKRPYFAAKLESLKKNV